MFALSFILTMGLLLNTERVKSYFLFYFIAPLADFYSSLLRLCRHSAGLPGRAKEIARYLPRMSHGAL